MDTYAKTPRAVAPRVGARLGAAGTQAISLVGIHPVPSTRGKPEVGGTWTQTGANVQLLQKGSGASHQGALVLDPSGRRMSLKLGQSKAQVVFTRA